MPPGIPARTATRVFSPHPSSGLPLQSCQAAISTRLCFVSEDYNSPVKRGCARRVLGPAVRSPSAQSRALCRANTSQSWVCLSSYLIPGVLKQVPQRDTCSRDLDWYSMQCARLGAFDMLTFHRSRRRLSPCTTPNATCSSRALRNFASVSFIVGYTNANRLAKWPTDSCCASLCLYCTSVSRDSSSLFFVLGFVSPCRRLVKVDPHSSPLGI